MSKTQANTLKDRIVAVGITQRSLVDKLTSQGITMDTGRLCNILNGKLVTPASDLVLDILDEMLTKIETALK